MAAFMYHVGSVVCCFFLFVFVLFYEIAAVGSELLALNLPGI